MFAPASAARPVVITLLFATVPEGVIAADATGDASALPTVTVNAHPLGDHGNLELAHPASVVNAAALRERRRSGIGQALEAIPGVQTSDFGPGASRPIIRGLGGPRVRVLQDGLGSMDVSGLSDDHAVALDILSVEQIEVLKGPATLLYGSGASGGVVNLSTDRLPLIQPDTFHSRLDLRYDSATVERQVGVHVDSPLGPFALHVDGVTRDSNNYLSGAGRIANSAVELGNYAVGLGYIGERAEFAVGHERFDSNYQIPGDVGFIVLQQRRYTARARLHDPLPGLNDINARFGYGEYAHTEFEDIGIAGTNFDNDECELRVEAEHEAILDWRGVVGVQHIGRDFGALGEEAFVPEPVERRDTGVFWVGERDSADWHYELGLRGEVSNNSTEGGLAASDFLVWSGSAGSTWRFAPAYSVALAYTFAERAPAIEELYANGAHAATGTFEVGSTAITPEQAHNLDLTLRRLQGRFNFQTSVYANRIQDFIYLEAVDADADGTPDLVDAEGRPDPAGEFDSVRYTQADAWFVGAELEAGYRLLDDARGSLDAVLRLDAVHARRDGGERLPRISPFRIGGGLNWVRDAWTADVDVTRVADQNDTAPGETATEGYVLVELGVGWDTAIGNLDYHFHARGTNLLDATARRHTSFLKDQAPLPGRALMTGVSVSF